MSLRRHGATLLVTMVVSAACGRSTVVTRPLAPAGPSVAYRVGDVRPASDRVPPAFTERLSAALWARLANAGRAARKGDTGAYRIDVSITSHRRRSAATRILFGVMAGPDRAEAVVTVVTPDGRVAGEWTAAAYNATALADGDYVANALADEIVRTLLSSPAPSGT